MLGFRYEIKRLMLEKHAFKNIDLYLVFHTSLKANNIANVWKVMNNTSGCSAHLLEGVYLIFQQVFSFNNTQVFRIYRSEREIGLKCVM